MVASDDLSTLHAVIRSGLSQARRDEGIDADEVVRCFSPQPDEDQAHLAGQRRVRLAFNALSALLERRADWVRGGRAGVFDEALGPAFALLARTPNAPAYDAIVGVNVQRLALPTLALAAFFVLHEASIDVLAFCKEGDPIP